MSGDNSRNLVIWDIEKLEVMFKIKDISSKINDILDVYDGQLVFLAAERNIRVLFMDTLEQYDSLQDLNNEVNCLAFDETSHTLYSSGKDPNIKIWDMSKKKII